ncbi:hypothetical protein QAD02_001623 [Eretmocerus hayati]|uniref:Uncharacterized protein n=1 Tax=Eretmocerus hayati TaxID=131215 RepID=A0ACC2NGX6_9HYME|nr:hypothetical protein QAD02_001623 [Eretmocerus hayati]
MHDDSCIPQQNEPKRLSDQPVTTVDEVKRGRKFTVISETVLFAIKSYDLFNTNGTLKNRGDPVSRNNLEELKGALTPLYTFVSVHQDKNDSRTQYCTSKGINGVEGVKANESEETEEDEEEINDEATKEEITRKGNDIQFQFRLTHEEYVQIELVLVTCANGYCTVKACNAPILIECYKEPEENTEVDFFVTTRGTNGIPHLNKKRQLKGIQRKKIQGELEYLTPRAWRLKKANEMMNKGDPKPPQLYSPQVLSKARQEKLYSKLGLDETLSSLDNFSQMMDDNRYAHFLQPRLIGFDRFWIIYYPEDQIRIGNHYLTVRKARASLDLTGKIIINVNDAPGYTRESLFAATTITVGGGIFPILQWLSKKSTGLFIMNALLRYKRAGGAVPSYMCTDMSIAL